MVLRFQSNDPRRRPPNYRSRSIQARIFLLIAGLMILLAFVPDLRVPGDGTWWDFSERPIAGGAPLTDAERSNERVDTRLQREAESPESAIVRAPKVSNSLSESDRETHLDADASPVDRAWQHGWETIYRQLSSSERLTLFAGIRSVRHRHRITEENWLPLLDRLDTLWIDYQMQALQSLAKLPSDERDAWRQVIDRIAARWSDDWRPRFEQWSQGVEGGGRAEGDTDAQKAAGANSLAGESVVSRSVDPGEAAAQYAIEFQRMLDRFALAEVRDDALLSRPEERESWFRLLERLADSSSQELKRGSIGPTGYLQLYDQPRSYRGKLVTVRGIVHQAYRLNEPQKQWGIDGYYVFTLRPAGGPARPMIVYALGLPEGFPTIDPMSPTGEMTQLFEEVEFTGYFFKRMPYLASDGINRAPLILAREPTWTKPVAVPSRRRLPWLRIALVASAGVVLAIWAFRLATSSLPQRHPRELLPSRIELTQVPASGEQDRSGGGPDARGSTDPSASGPDSGRTRDGRPNTNGAGGAS